MPTKIRIYNDTIVTHNTIWRIKSGLTINWSSIIKGDCRRLRGGWSSSLKTSTRYAIVGPTFRNYGNLPFGQSIRILRIYTFVNNYNKKTNFPEMCRLVAISHFSKCRQRNDFSGPRREKHSNVGNDYQVMLVECCDQLDSACPYRGANRQFVLFYEWLHLCGRIVSFLKGSLTIHSKWPPRTYLTIILTNNSWTTIRTG